MYGYCGVSWSAVGSASSDSGIIAAGGVASSMTEDRIDD